MSAMQPDQYNSEHYNNYEDPGSDEEAVGDGRPTIVIMGQKRSGKTSIRKVVFQKMSPNETVFCESTPRVMNEPITGSFINLQTIEFPGQLDAFDTAFNPKEVFSTCGALLFVIDAQADLPEALRKMSAAMIRAYNINKNIKFEVFVHKVDGLSEETRMATYRRIFQKVQDDLADHTLDNIYITYHMTSIYDHSIFEAFSKVIQKLVRQLPALIKLLDMFNTACSVEKSYLFDVSSKIYVATDSNPPDLSTYELCCDMIDITTDLTGIYGKIDTNAPPQDGYNLESQSVVRLKVNQVLFMKQVDKYLALIGVMKKEPFEKKGLIDYNFQIFKNGVTAVFEIGRLAITRH
uniref:GTP-binding protein n=1 Tax=Panagrellus redivivus TaxID=6233 RepID=A0A7E4UM08_PANRE